MFECLSDCTCFHKGIDGVLGITNESATIACRTFGHQHQVSASLPSYPILHLITPFVPSTRSSSQAFYDGELIVQKKVEKKQIDEMIEFGKAMTYINMEPAQPSKWAHIGDKDGNEVYDNPSFWRSQPYDGSYFNRGYGKGGMKRASLRVVNLVVIMNVSPYYRQESQSIKNVVIAFHAQGSLAYCWHSRGIAEAGWHSLQSDR